jgi:uncharacterized membrane protein YhaH (DUF805 family)
LFVAGIVVLLILDGFRGLWPIIFLIPLGVGIDMFKEYINNDAPFVIIFFLLIIVFIIIYARCKNKKGNKFINKDKSNKEKRV